MDPKLIEKCEMLVARTIQRYRLTSDSITLETITREIVAGIASEIATARQETAA